MRVGHRDHGKTFELFARIRKPALQGSCGIDQGVARRSPPERTQALAEEA